METPIELSSSTAFEIQQGTISRASNKERLGCNTIITNQRMERYGTATLSHFRRIADYLERETNVWYILHDDAIEFLDGDNEPDDRPEGPKKSCFR